MKILLILLFLLFPVSTYSLSGDQCYFYGAVLLSGPKCLKIENMENLFSFDQKTRLLSTIASQCANIHHQEWVAGGLVGAEDLQSQFSCKEIINTYIELFKEYNY